MFKWKKNNQSIIDKPCNHVYTSFGNYYCEYDDTNKNPKYPYTLAIKRVYVCVKCKHREVVVLDEMIFTTLSAMKEQVSYLEEEDIIKEKYRVESEINDFIYLNPEDLRIFEMVHALNVKKTKEFIARLEKDTEELSLAPSS